MERGASGGQVAGRGLGAALAIFVAGCVSASAPPPHLRASDDSSGGAPDLGGGSGDGAGARGGDAELEPDPTVEPDGAEAADTAEDRGPAPEPSPAPEPFHGAEPDPEPSPPDCASIDAGSPCLEAVDDPLGGGCRLVARAPKTPCDDGDACTLGEKCDVSAQCKGAPLTCADDSACTLDTCHEVLGCQFVALSDVAPCDDGSPCTASDHCDGGGACTGTIGDEGCVTCKFDFECEGEAFPCMDVACVGGSCVLSPTKKCVDPEEGPCTTTECDPATDGCVKKPLEVGTPCSDGSSCTPADQCDGLGSCAGGPKKDCSDAAGCTVDGCEGLAQDGIACSHFSQCGCAGDEECPALPVGCLAPVCLAGTCAYEPIGAGTSIECDGDPGTAGDSCAAFGVCVPGAPVE